MFNFTVGQPSESLIPHTILEKAIESVSKRKIDPFVFQYSPQLGPFPARQMLAEFLSKTYLYPQFSPENVGLTFGNSLGIANALGSLLTPGEQVICEDLTYFLIGKILRDAGLRTYACPVSDSSGLDIDKLEEMIVRIRPRLVYINPVHQNPTGSVFPIGSRERLLQLSKRYDFYIFSDEPYVLLSFSNENLSEELGSMALTAARIYPYDDFKNLVCFGTFSKIVTPGLRCGWISGHPSIISRISENGALMSGGGPPNLITEIIRSLIDSGEMSRHISFLQRELSERAERMIQSMEHHFGSEVKFHAPRGGYFLFVTFPTKVDTSLFYTFCQEKGFRIKFLPGAKCKIYESLERNSSIRFAFSFYTSGEIEEGIAHLREAYDEFRKSI